MYRLSPVVIEEDAEGLWAGGVPDGPIIHVSGSGELILEVLRGHSSGVDLAGIVEQLHELFEGLPDDAVASIRDFLRMLEDIGFVDEVAQEPGGEEEG